MRKNFHDLTIAEVLPETRDAVTLAFDIPQMLAGAFDFKPGQYLTLRATIDGEDVRRSYSICSLPGERLRVGIKHVPEGRFSGFARKLEAGDKLKVMPPNGRFTLDAGRVKKGNYLLVAAGSGITPILSIVRCILESRAESRVMLIYGNQTTGSIMFREELANLKDRFVERFQLQHILSREARDVELLHGRIDAARMAQMIDKGLIMPALIDAVYLCGPIGMSEAVAGVLKSNGVARSKIHVELFDTAKDSKPRPVSKEVIEATGSGVLVEFILDGVRHSFAVSDPDDTVVSAAQKSGFELPFSCRGGMCATCRCKLVEGKVEMATNYALQPWELKAGFVLACQSRPKTGKLVLDFDAT